MIVHRYFQLLLIFASTGSLDTEIVEPVDHLARFCTVRLLPMVSQMIEKLLIVLWQHF